MEETTTETTVVYEPVIIDPVDMGDIGDFLHSVVIGFQDPIFFGYVLMLTFALLIGIRRLLVGGN